MRKLQNLRKNVWRPGFDLRALKVRKSDTCKSLKIIQFRQKYAQNKCVKNFATTEFDIEFFTHQGQSVSSTTLKVISFERISILAYLKNL